MTIIASPAVFICAMIAPAMKIALAQINPLIGDFAGNSAKIISAARAAAHRGCRLVVLPELALSGYPPQDLLERPAFIADHESALSRLIAQVRGIGVLCGAVTRNPAASGKPLHNSALLFEDGRLLAQVAKRLLPTYDVFDEARYFEPGGPAGVVDFHGLRLAITVCEDIWNDPRIFPRCLYHCDPVSEILQAGGGADLLLNLAASPFNLGKSQIKQRIFSNICTSHRLPLLHVNQVGGQDSLVFAGESLALDGNGRLLCRAASFREDLVVLDTATWQGEIRPVDYGEGLPVDSLGDSKGERTAVGGEVGEAEKVDEAAEVLAALVLGTGDYVRKCGFSGVVLGLSGGIDSALVAAIAARALGPANVLGIAMPSPYSSAASLEDARRLAESLGIGFAELPISPILADFLQTLTPLFNKFTESRPAPAAVDLTEQNLQARIRGNLLMAAANRLGRLLLSTGNKSEMAVGYCTLYGDMSGALAPLADVPKTLVYRLARLVNQNGEVIPDRTLTRPPSAELAPDQRDQDDLPPYEVLDPILKAYLEDQLPIGEIIARGFAPAVVHDVVGRVLRNEHKRRQAPPGLKVTGKAFGPGRRYPIAENYRESLPIRPG